MAVAVSLDSGTADSVAGTAAGTVHYFGYSVKESAAAPGVAKFNIRGGGSVTGLLLDAVTLNPSESRSEWYGPQGIQVTGPLYLEVVSGSFTGSLRFS